MINYAKKKVSTKTKIIESINVLVKNICLITLINSEIKIWKIKRNSIKALKKKKELINGYN
jgi:hypothetical protein